MKSFIYFNPGAYKDYFEGARLRKNLKGSLELNDVSWVASPFAEHEIVHLLSPDDVLRGREAKEDGKKLIVSALYAEHDPSARFFEDGGDERVLKMKAERLLEDADLILVPNENAARVLKDAGVKNPHVKILSPGVSLARFERNDPMEKLMFPRYMRMPNDTKYVLVVNDYGNESVIEELKALAGMAPSVQFFMVGMERNRAPSNFYLRRLARKSPRNIRYLGILNDDVYRSALLNATVFLEIPTDVDDSLPLLEAMAAKTQVIVDGDVKGQPLLENAKTCLAFTKTEDCAKALEAYCASPKGGTTFGAYKLAKANSLAEVGAELKKIYESILISEDE